MATTVTPCSMPSASALQARRAGASFHDSYRVAVADAQCTALGHFLRAVAHTPAWVNGLMALRNRAVALVGLKDLGVLSGLDPAKPEAAYRPGDRVGIFTLLSNTPDEVLLGDNDKHLDVVLSVWREPAADGHSAGVVVTTLVREHNLLGRLYMLPVVPVHRRIVPAVMASLASG